MNSKLQLEKPMSRALATPGKDILRMFSLHGSVIRAVPVDLGRELKTAKLVNFSI